MAELAAIEVEHLLPERRSAFLIALWTNVSSYSIIDTAVFCIEMADRAVKGQPIALPDVSEASSCAASSDGGFGAAEQRSDLDNSGTHAI